MSGCNEERCEVTESEGGAVEDRDGSKMLSD